MEKIKIKGLQIIENGVKIEVIDQEWDMINEENVGNVGERNIRDFEIYEEK